MEERFQAALDKKEKRLKKLHDEMLATQPTFKPKINDHSLDLRKSKRRSEAPIHERLFQLSKANPSDILANQMSTDKEVECVFRPTINSAYNNKLMLRQIENGEKEALRDDGTTSYALTKSTNYARDHGASVTDLLYEDAARRREKLQYIESQMYQEEQRRLMEPIGMAKKSLYLAKKKMQKNLAAGYGYIMRNCAPIGKEVTF